MRKFLIVDDEPGILKLLSAILLEEGFQVQTASNGLEALTALQQEKGWVVLLDLMMPRFNGYEVLQQLRNQPQLRNTNVIVLMSAGADLQEAGPLLMQGEVQALLPKPFDLSKVLTLAEQLADQPATSNSAI
jgi:CheY-like chemotaxis protein